MIQSIVYSVLIFTLAKRHPSTGTMALEPNILQKEMPFLKYKYDKKLIKINRKIREIASDCCNIRQNSMNVF